jgi:hypothetical protein
LLEHIIKMLRQLRGDNIPPIVLAGDDIYLSNNQTTASVIATAYDPDGFIISQEWTKITGGFVLWL